MVGGWGIKPFFLLFRILKSESSYWQICNLHQSKFNLVLPGMRYFGDYDVYMAIYRFAKLAGFIAPIYSAYLLIVPSSRSAQT